jgi:hypothetical protein
MKKQAGKIMGCFAFVYNSKLGIELPRLDGEWEDMPEDERARALLRWEEIRGRIPDRIKELESEIVRKQELLNNEDDFQKSCVLNSEIAGLAGIINELNIWFRTGQNMTNDKPHR